jgi:hypothetical protein
MFQSGKLDNLQFIIPSFQVKLNKNERTLVVILCNKFWSTYFPILIYLK